MNVTIFGVGYVGLVQGAVLADMGHQVLCVDVDSEKVDNLKQAIIPIFEPGLEALVQSTQAQGLLQFTANAEEGVQHGDIIFIAVGTPPDEDGSADLKYVLTVAETIAQHMDGYRLVVNKSTVPVGTADLVKQTITSGLDSRACTYAFDVVSNPEFLKEGSALNDCQYPDRIIIGTESHHAERSLRELYASLSHKHDKIIVMDIRSAELTKYVANCMLATKISFINEMAGLAERLGADIQAVRKGIGSDPRIGYHFIDPGVGYGGSCFPKDVQALIHTAEHVDFEPTMLKAVEARNHDQKKWLFHKIFEYFSGDLNNKVIALWGLAFKPNTDDMREAPSRVLIEQLLDAGARIQAFDPVAMQEAQRIYGVRQDLVFCETQEAALEGADALAIVTECSVFRNPNFEQLMVLLKSPVIFDGRNLYEPEILGDKGFVYRGIGRV
ncbi:MAG: UDP-glucose/GDP-mannose dehydrogenase family protein [Legionellaceae bacterium]|nr:UDP-glucose/GDP-mannose dehydrogenase family protein [Legionellaceae bacterium]